jgi:hypothetical protein
MSRDTCEDSPSDRGVNLLAEGVADRPRSEHGLGPPVLLKAVPLVRQQRDGQRYPLHVHPQPGEGRVNLGREYRPPRSLARPGKQQQVVPDDAGRHVVCQRSGKPYRPLPGERGFNWVMADMECPPLGDGKADPHAGRLVEDDPRGPYA